MFTKPNTKKPIIVSYSHHFHVCSWNGPWIKPRGIFKTKKRTDLGLMACDEKNNREFLILTLQVCINENNLHYRSLPVLAETGFLKSNFDSSIVPGSSFPLFEVNMCESNMKDSIRLTKLENIKKYLQKTRLKSTRTIKNIILKII